MRINLRLETTDGLESVIDLKLLRVKYERNA